MKLSVRWVVPLILGLGVGASVGVIYARRTIGWSSDAISQWAAGSQYSGLAGLQYRYADKHHAREALSDFISFTQQMRDTGKVADPKTLETEVALAYMRLAALDRRGGNMEGYQSNVSRAQEALRAGGVQPTSVEDMEKFLNQHEPLRLVEPSKVK